MLAAARDRQLIGRADACRKLNRLAEQPETQIASTRRNVTHVKMRTHKQWKIWVLK